MTSEKRYFVLGMVTAFCECAAAGCKDLALSPPLTGGEYAEIADEAEALIERHGLLHYHERNLDRPKSARHDWILIAAREETLREYRRLREEGYSPLDSLAPFSKLLSYDPSRGVGVHFDAFREYFPKEPSGA